MEAPVRGGEHSGEMRDERGGRWRGRRGCHGGVETLRGMPEMDELVVEAAVTTGPPGDSFARRELATPARRRHNCWGSHVQTCSSTGLPSPHTKRVSKLQISH